MTLFAAIIAITNLCGAVGVDTHGARVVSYVPVCGSEVFFTSETGAGGMPLCWPWFAGLGPDGARRHGIVRYLDFSVEGVTNRTPWDSEIVLRLESCEATRRVFPHDFTLTVSVRLTDRLSVSMTGENTGNEPFAVTEALHPYFAVGDTVRSRVEERNNHERRLVDPADGNELSLACSGGGFRVWRPNQESHLSKLVSAITPDDWRRFICVEFGTFTSDRAHVLNPGERHTLTGTIRRLPQPLNRVAGPDLLDGERIALDAADGM